MSIKLPEPMYGFTPIISDDHYIILGYCGADTAPCRSACKIAVDEITKSNHHQQTRAVPTKWYRMAPSPHRCTALVSSLLSPIKTGIKYYDL